MNTHPQTHEVSVMQFIRNARAARHPSVPICAAAVAGSALGAVTGALAGPAGIALGLTVGGAVGALLRSPGTLQRRSAPPEAPYYTSSDTFVDYGPAYRFGHETCSQFRGRRFEEMEAELESLWRSTSEARHLTWDQVRYPVRRIWSRSGRAPAENTASGL